MGSVKRRASPLIVMVIPVVLSASMLILPHARLEAVMMLHAAHQTLAIAARYLAPRIAIAVLVPLCALVMPVSR